MPAIFPAPGQAARIFPPVLFFVDHQFLQGGRLMQVDGLQAELPGSIRICAGIVYKEGFSHAEVLLINDRPE